MKNLKTLIFISVLTFNGHLIAQVPGYIGKKFHLQGGIMFFPSFGNIPVNLTQPESYYIVSGMNYRLELSLERMISRKSSLGLNGQYYNTASRNYYAYPPSIDSRYAIEGGGIGLVFKTHFGSWIAPLGSYFRAEGGALIMSQTDPKGNLNGTLPPTIGATGYIKTSIGRTHIFANRISLDYGFEVGWVFPPYDVYSFQGTSNTRMAFHYLANAYIKLGGIF